MNKDIISLIFSLLLILIPYLLFGMSKSSDTEYMLKGWFFAPARLFKRFICSMFIGHSWTTEGYCSFCLKKRRKNGTSN